MKRKNSCSRRGERSRTNAIDCACRLFAVCGGGMESSAGWLFIALLLLYTWGRCVRSTPVLSSPKHQSRCAFCGREINSSGLELKKVAPSTRVRLEIPPTFVCPVWLAAGLHISAYAPSLVLFHTPSHSLLICNVKC